MRCSSRLSPDSGSVTLFRAPHVALMYPREASYAPNSAAQTISAGKGRGAAVCRPSTWFALGLTRPDYGMKMPCTANSVLAGGVPRAVRATVGDLNLLDLDVGALAVLDRNARQHGVGRRVDGARRADGGRRRRGAGRVHGERDVLHCRGVRTAARSDCVPVVGDPDQGVALDLTGVVGTVGRVGRSTGRVAGLAADVRRVRGELHVGVLGRTRDTNLHRDLERRLPVRVGPVRVERADRQVVRLLDRRVARREHQWRPVGAVAGSGALVERGHQRRRSGLPRADAGAWPRQPRLRPATLRQLRPVPAVPGYAASGSYSASSHGLGL